MRKTDKPHHYYKIAAESVTGMALQTFMSKCQAAEEKAREWAERQGADHYFESPAGMAGGIAAVDFENCIEKENWDKVTMPDGSVIFLPAPDSELEKEMYALPVVNEAELIDILQFVPCKDKDGKFLPFTFGNTTPVIFLHHGYWYADMPYECKSEDCLLIEEKIFYRRRMAATNERE